jgi:hypothetical protein
MKKAMLLVALAAWVGVTGVSSSAQEGGPPKAGPEHKRIEYFKGTWNFVGDAKASPMGPAGTVTFKETCELYEGGFALVCRSEGKNPMGPAKSISIMSYDVEKKAYTYTAAETKQPVFTAYGQVTNSTWNWKTESSMGGKTMAVLVTITEKGGNAYDFKMEMAMDGGAPTTVMEGKATKSGT